MAWKNVQYENGKLKTSEGGGGGGSSTFADLDDINFSDLQNGQVAKYNSETQKWENTNESSGVANLSDLNDVNLTDIQDSQILKYDSENNEFVNSDILVSGITCLFRGDIPANSYVDVAVTEGTYLFLAKSISVHGIIAVFYDSKSGGTVSTNTIASGENINIFSFSKPQNGYIRISLNNQWARSVVLYKLI